MHRILLLFVLSGFVFSCEGNKTRKEGNSETSAISSMRPLHDTIGFAQYSWQMDSIIARMDPSDTSRNEKVYKAVICPHDDYAYAGGLYFKTLSGIRAKTIILIGVAHRAINFNLQDRIIFGSHSSWASAEGEIKVSELRDRWLQKLQPTTHIVHDSMMRLEHSLEAMTPFLKRMNPEVEIIPLLVPYMKFEDMDTFSSELSQTLSDLMREEQLDLGNDVAIVISNDAIHYGTTGWGRNNMAPYGVDKEGNQKAHDKDRQIIAECLVDEITSEKIEKFTTHTVVPYDYKTYQWTWCGRYSTPFGLLLANKLTQQLTGESLNGSLIDYRSSLISPKIEVLDLGMGHTAPALETHWVAYAGIGYQ